MTSLLPEFGSEAILIRQHFFNVQKKNHIEQIINLLQELNFLSGSTVLGCSTVTSLLKTGHFHLETVTRYRFASK